MLCSRFEPIATGCVCWWIQWTIVGPQARLFGNSDGCQNRLVWALNGSKVVNLFSWKFVFQSFFNPGLRRNQNLMFCHFKRYGVGHHSWVLINEPKTLLTCYQLCSFTSSNRKKLSKKTCVLVPFFLEARSVSLSKN